MKQPYLRSKDFVSWPLQIFLWTIYSLPYFFNDIDRLFDPKYQPTEKDIVHTRARTVGITETKFKLDSKDRKNSTMTVVDVGGQKTERRKWIHQFQDVTSILFLVNLSGYDQCLVEDKDGVCHPITFEKGIRTNLRSESNARCDDRLGFNM